MYKYFKYMWASINLKGKNNAHITYESCIATNIKNIKLSKIKMVKQKLKTTTQSPKNNAKKPKAICQKKLFVEKY